MGALAGNVLGRGCGKGETYSGCRVRRSTSQSLPQFGWHAVSFDTVLDEVDDYFDAATNPTRLTVPYNGFYTVACVARVSHASNFSPAGGIRVNGSLFVCVDKKYNTTEHYVSVELGLHLDKDDYIEFVLSQGQVAAATIDSLADFSPVGSILCVSRKP